MENEKPKVIQELEKEILKYNPDFTLENYEYELNSNNQLVMFFVEGGSLNNISFVNKLSNLIEFVVINTPLEDISPIQNLKNLVKLTLAENDVIKDFSPCDLPNLKKIDLIDCQTNSYINLSLVHRIQTNWTDKRYPHINWVLNKKINVLIGNNGTGKTTILNLIFNLLKGNVNVYEDCNYKIFFNQKEYITSNMYEVYLKLQNFKNDIYATVTIDKNTFPNVTFLKTFDTELLTLEVAQKISDDRVKTKLDYILYQWLFEFRRYDSRMSKRLEKLFLESSPEVDLRAERQKLYETKTYFIDTVNRLFGETGKTLEITPENDIFFQVKNTRISPFELSSGEKQMLVIMLSVLTQDNQPHVLLMDEPESSLHLDWQEELIEILRTLNPNCQLIIATHAPALIQEGYWDYVTDIEDIIKPANEIENV